MWFLSNANVTTWYGRPRGHFDYTFHGQINIWSQMVCVFVCSSTCVCLTGWPWHTCNYTINSAKKLLLRGQSRTWNMLECLYEHVVQSMGFSMRDLINSCPLKIQTDLDTFCFYVFIYKKYLFPPKLAWFQVILLNLSILLFYSELANL